MRFYVFVNMKPLVIKFLVMIELNRDMTCDSIDLCLGERRATRTINLEQTLPSVIQKLIRLESHKAGTNVAMQSQKFHGPKAV